MIHSQYLRFESEAGGVCATPRELIRVARSHTTPRGKSRELRAARHNWLRSMLAQHSEARGVYVDVMRGNA